MCYKLKFIVNYPFSDKHTAGGDLNDLADSEKSCLILELGSAAFCHKVITSYFILLNMQYVRLLRFLF